MYSRFTSTLRIGCCRSSSGTQQALARQRRRDEGAENQLEKCSKSGRKEEAEHILPLVPPLCLAGACCAPELCRQQPILSVDVNLVRDRRPSSVRAFFSDLGSSGKRIRNSERLFITRRLRRRRGGGGGRAATGGRRGTNQRTTEGAAHARRHARFLARHILRRHVDAPTTHLLLRLLLLRYRRGRPPEPDILLHPRAIRRANIVCGGESSDLGHLSL